MHSKVVEIATAQRRTCSFPALASVCPFRIYARPRFFPLQQLNRVRIQGDSSSCVGPQPSPAARDPLSHRIAELLPFESPTLALFFCRVAVGRGGTCTTNTLRTAYTCQSAFSLDQLAT